MLLRISNKKVIFRHPNQSILSAFLRSDTPIQMEKAEIRLVELLGWCDEITETPEIEECYRDDYLFDIQLKTLVNPSEMQTEFMEQNSTKMRKITISDNRVDICFRIHPEILAGSDYESSSKITTESAFPLCIAILRRYRFEMRSSCLFLEKNRRIQFHIELMNSQHQLGFPVDTGLIQRESSRLKKDPIRTLRWFQEMKMKLWELDVIHELVVELRRLVNKDNVNNRSKYFFKAY